MLSPQQIAQMNAITGMNKPVTGTPTPVAQAGNDRAAQIRAIAARSAPYTQRVSQNMGAGAQMIAQGFEQGGAQTVADINQGADEYGKAQTPIEKLAVAGKTAGEVGGNVVNTAMNTAIGAGKIAASPVSQINVGGETIGNRIADKNASALAAQKAGNDPLASVHQGQVAQVKIGGIDLQKYFTENPDVARSTLNLINTLGLTGGGKVLETPIESPAGVANTLKEGATTAVNRANTALGTAQDSTAGLFNAAKDPKALDAYIMQQFEKGVRPTVVGKSTAGQIEAYQGRARQALETIVDNKLNLELKDAEGTPIPDAVPHNLTQFSDAIQQTQKQIFDLYDAERARAGEAGAKVDLAPVAGELKAVVDNPVINDLHPEVVKYTQARIDSLLTRGTYDTAQAQDAIKMLNASLKAYYRNPTFDTATRAEIDALIVNKMREQLDSTIENSGGAGYQQLKNQYGALKTIEKEVNHRAIVDARKNTKGLIDFADIAAGSDLVRGIITLNPADFAQAATIHGIKRYWQYLNNPNTAIKRMFQAVEEARRLRAVKSPPFAEETPPVATKTPKKNAITPVANRPEYTPNSQKTAEAFLKSGGQKVLTNKDGIQFEIGDWGRNHQTRKMAEVKVDRFPESELKATLDEARAVFPASNDPKTYRYDNVIWVTPEMDGIRAVYTRTNAHGAEEVIAWHSVPETKVSKYLEDIGVPSQNRTGILSLERSGSSPLTYGDTTNITSQYQEVKASRTGEMGKTDSLYQRLNRFLRENGIQAGMSAKDVSGSEEAQNLQDAVHALRNSKGLSASDIMAKHPDIQLKRDVLASDIYGDKITIPEGEALTPYELKGNRVLLQDGETYIVSKNQYQNIKGNSVVGEAKPFAPELAQTEETVLGGGAKPLSPAEKIRLAELEKLNAKHPLGAIEDIQTGSWDELLTLQNRRDGLNISELYDKQKEIERQAQRAQASGNQKLANALFNESNHYNARAENLGINPHESLGIQPKYESYQLPGGKNYKEILIRAPEKNMDSNVRVVKQENGRYEVQVNGEAMSSNIPTYAEAVRSSSAYKHIQNEQEIFKSSHYPDYANPLSHIRLNERTYQGKPVTFMEEAQSDWARAGREKGFATDITKDSAKQQGFTVAKAKTNMGDEAYFIDNHSDPYMYRKGFPNTGFPTEESAWNALVEKLKTGTVPNNPLLKNWTTLAIQRALKEAVNNGSDYFAWINGEQTSARYNLATKLDSVEWRNSDLPEPFYGEEAKIDKVISLMPNNRNRAVSVAVDRQGKILQSEQESAWVGKKLDQVLGKGLADAIMSKESGTLSGEGLKFGGEWAHNLYDKQVGNIVSDLTGAKVEKIDMGLPIDAANKTWTNRAGTATLKPETMKVGMEVRQTGTGLDSIYVITDILGDGKFKAVQKSRYEQALKDAMTLRGSQYLKNPTDAQKIALFEKEFYPLNAETFDISTKKSAGQQAIKLTPEIKAKIRGEAPAIKKPSGKSPF